MRRQAFLVEVEALVAICLCFAIGRALLADLAALDADRHYHMAISRMASASGRLSALPQAEDIGWAAHFPDKEYLFHFLTTWSYRIGGEPGVDSLCLFLGAFALAALYALCRTATSPAVAAGFCVCGALLNSLWLFRLSMVRPHVLAIALLLWLCVGLLTRTRWLACAAAAGFALAYHAFYVPLGVLFLFALVNWRERPARVLAAWTLGAFVLGTVVNPYFPSNLGAGALMLKVGLTTQAASEGGAELAPYTGDVFLIRFGIQLLFVGIAIARPWWLPYAPGERSRVAFLCSGALVFLALSALTPRAAEYAVPLSACVGAHSLSGVRWPWRGAVLGLALMVQGPRFLIDRQADGGRTFRESTVTAVESLPKKAAGDKVMNCVFDGGEILLHLRPDVRFVDLLDPSFLEQAAPALAAKRRAFQEGHVTDALAVVRNDFRANYVLCGKREANAMLDDDPRFARIFPSPDEHVDPGSVTAVYAALDTPIPSVRRFQVEPTGDRPAGEAYELPPNHDYLDLAMGARTQCVRLQIPSDELARFEGAELAVVGGGPRIALEIDGARIFQTASPFSSPRWNDAAIPLRGALSRSQRVVVETCPAFRTFSGVALSFWTWDQARKRCDAVGRPMPANSAGIQTDRATCLAPFAAISER